MYRYVCIYSIHTYIYTCIIYTHIYAYICGFLKIYLFLAALGLHCCEQAFSSCSEQGLPFFAVRGLLIAEASLAAELGL